MDTSTLKEKYPSACCISHMFHRAASKNPEKIAVIHASGGAQIAKQFHTFFQNTHNQSPVSEANTSKNNNDCDYDIFSHFMAEKKLSSHPPIYEGDLCFTYSDILSAVDSLSFRLQRILEGGDDPCLIRPTSVDTSTKDKLEACIPEQSSEYQRTYVPKILGIYMAPSVDYVVGVLSVLRCGQAFLPLDPSWPKERILSIVSSSKAELILGSQSSSLSDNSHWLVDETSCPMLLSCIENNLVEQTGMSYLSWPCKSEKSRLFCYLMYTSGSTGKPKGVCGTELGLLNRFIWMEGLYPLHGEELLLFKTSISFIDHLQEFLGALLTTCTLVIPPFDELKEKVFFIIQYLQAYSVARLITIPSLMRAVLPSLQGPHNKSIQSSLKLLVLSGEVLHTSLWNMLSDLLPETTILNLYGSTEVAGDCTCFDCKRLPLFFNEMLSSIPLGLPISNCDIMLVGEEAPNQGEICVAGSCVAAGYFDYPSIKPLDNLKLPEDSCLGGSVTDHKSRQYFKTGDYARKLESGDLVFLGRKDRTIKVNGQRFALEEIESTLMEYPGIVDAAVISTISQGDIALVQAYLVTNQKDKYIEILRSIRSWMTKKLPLAMIPNRFFCIKSLPKSSTGKVDYSFLASLDCSMDDVCIEVEETPDSVLLQVVKKAFCDALEVEKVSSNDDFFARGGTSISAAHASHNLGIDMRLLYSFPTPLKLQWALLGNQVLDGHNNGALPRAELKVIEGSWFPSDGIANVGKNKLHKRLSRTLSDEEDVYPIKSLKLDSQMHLNLKSLYSKDGRLWNSSPLQLLCSVGRCNKIMYGREYEGNSTCQVNWPQEIHGVKKGHMRELWKVNLESCVDASPLVVFKDRDVYLFIGSHSRKFLCINAMSGFVHWKIILEGRIESSAAILDDFSQVVVGCYQGKIYFLDFFSGSICWAFQTGGEVKSQPVVDRCRHLVWCGSYDHNLYALDYKSHSCIYKLPCGGSIYGSPAIDEAKQMLYVASTSGLVTAVCLKASSCSKLWLQDLGAPIFGSLSINSCNGTVICCLVDGHVVALHTDGSTLWRGKACGPIFAGPCISHTLSGQVLICCRDGSIYSFELESGDLLWKYNVGYPLTSSAYIDENMQLISEFPSQLERLVCVCTSSGCIRLLRISSHAIGEINDLKEYVVQEFARLELGGDIFSSPVMIGGRIFVGCRDDYVHCIGLAEELVE